MALIENAAPVTTKVGGKRCRLICNPVHINDTAVNAMHIPRPNINVGKPPLEYRELKMICANQ